MNREKKPFPFKIAFDSWLWIVSWAMNRSWCREILNEWVSKYSAVQMTVGTKYISIFRKKFWKHRKFPTVPLQNQRNYELFNESFNVLLK